jgi:hypothetical protein
LITFLTITGVKAGVIWLSIAIISGLLTYFAYNQEKKDGFINFKEMIKLWCLIKITRNMTEEQNYH